MKNRILLATVVVMLTGWLVGCTIATSLETLIDYRRSGGLAGRDDHLIIKQSGEAILTRKTERYEFTLDAAGVDHLRTLFDAAAFSQLRREYVPPRQGNDLYEYAVTYRGHTVRTMDGAVPAVLQSILEDLNQIVESQGTS